MELENLYVCVDEMIELISPLKHKTVREKMEDVLYTDGIDIFIESLKVNLTLRYRHGDIDDNELEYLGNLIDSLDIEQLRTETEFLKMCNECIENA